MPITDLTGTKWYFDSNPSFGNLYNDGYDSLYFDFISDNNSYDNLVISQDLETNDYAVFYRNMDLGDTQVYSNETWQNQAYRTIQITGGEDATNTDLIAWLEQNATQIVEPTGNTYNLTHTLTNLTKGNITLQITPDSNYTYPTSLTITNGTLVSYDNTTGIAVINGDDTTIVNAECVEQASGYSGNISAFIYVSANSFPTKIKFDTRPTSDNDYDSYVNERGSLTGLTSYQNKTKVYVWGSINSLVRINGTIYNIALGNGDYRTAEEVLLTGNYDIELAYSIGGSGD